MKDFVRPQLPLLIRFDGGIAGKYKFPVKNQVAEINIDTAASHLLPGDYELIADPADISSQVTLIKFNVPPQQAEPNAVVKMVQKNGYLQAELDGQPLWFSGFRARRASQRERAYRDGNYRIILYGVSMGGSDGSNSGRTWLGPGRYEFSAIEDGLERFFKTYPETKIVITYGIDAPRWWILANPDECVWFEGKSSPEGLGR